MAYGRKHRFQTYVSPSDGHFAFTTHAVKEEKTRQETIKLAGFRSKS